MVFQVQVDVVIGLFFLNFKYIVLFIMNRIRISFEHNINTIIGIKWNGGSH